MNPNSIQQFIQKILKNIRKIYYIDTRQSKSNYFNISVPFSHFIMIFITLSLILFANLYYKYTIFSSLKNGLSFNAVVLNHYPKIPKNPKKPPTSDIFKLQDSNGNIFYATYKGKFKNLIGKNVRVYGKIYKCSFLQFLKSCRIYNSTISLVQNQSNKKIFTNFIAKQHLFKKPAPGFIDFLKGFLCLYLLQFCYLNYT